jgi:hypothetical protein
MRRDTLQLLYEHIVVNGAGGEDYGFALFAIIGVLLFILGVFVYIYIWSKNKNDLPDGQSWYRSIAYILSFTPRSSVVVHIIAGICVTLGLALSGGYFIGYRLNPNTLTSHSSAVGIASTIFSVLTCFITFWTLNQTKKIEHNQGHKIYDFPTLITRMANDINGLIRSYKENYKEEAQEFHRVYLITEHPFFGHMSFPADDYTKNLLFGYERLKELLEERDSGFVFEMICGSPGCVGEFIGQYYSGISNEETKRKRIEQEVNYFEKKISDFVEAGIATRVEELPRYPQFAIIGNTVFEFLIQARNPQTKSIETHVSMDANKCQLYIKTFELLKQVLPKYSV